MAIHDFFRKYISWISQIFVIPPQTDDQTVSLEIAPIESKKKHFPKQKTMGLCGSKLKKSSSSEELVEGGESNNGNMLEGTKHNGFTEDAKQNLDGSENGSSKPAGSGFKKIRRSIRTKAQRMANGPSDLDPHYQRGMSLVLSSFF